MPDPVEKRTAEQFAAQLLWLFAFCLGVWVGVAEMVAFAIRRLWLP